MYRAFLNKCLAMTYSHMGPPTLPSAQLHLTCMDALMLRCQGWQRAVTSAFLARAIVLQRYFR